MHRNIKFVKPWYAYKTRLCWCVFGPINCISNGITTSCNCVAVRDVALSELASHHFTMEKSVRDVSLEEMSQAMYRHDFREPELVGTSTMLKSDGVSCKDKNFMEIVERRASKKMIIMLFHNKKQAIQRLGSKEDLWRTTNSSKVNSSLWAIFLKNGFAKDSYASPLGKTWYIPHHGVYHLSKPGKISVVFDCSVEFQGKFINWWRKITFMADVETMYDQVQFLEDQQSYSKFLWWGNHDTYRGLHDYVICAHVFGATSWTSCSNYVLWRAVIENEAVFGKVAASALHHKFYVDDLLKIQPINLWKISSICASLVSSILPNSSPITRNCYC